VFSCIGGFVSVLNVVPQFLQFNLVVILLTASLSEIEISIILSI